MSRRRTTPIAQEITRDSVIQMESARRPASCDHLHDSTTRYDRVAKVLTFLLVCPVCETEKVIETCHYEARFEPHAATQPAGATVHQLPVRSTRPALRAA